LDLQTLLSRRSGIEAIGIEIMAEIVIGIAIAGATGIMIAIGDMIVMGIAVDRSGTLNNQTKTPPGVASVER
jgi:hypothetical protein